jgi:hypothetical protein
MWQRLGRDNAISPLCRPDRACRHRPHGLAFAEATTASSWCRRLTAGADRAFAEDSGAQPLSHAALEALSIGRRRSEIRQPRTLTPQSDRET